MCWHCSGNSNALGVPGEAGDTRQTERKEKMNNYKSWRAFTFKGTRYLGLEFKGGQTWLIVGEDMENYGTYYDIDSFRNFVDKSPNGEMDFRLGKF